MEFNYKSELGRYKRYYQNIGGFASKERTRNYSAVIFSFLAVSLFGWYAIRPTIQTILLLRKEIEDDKVVNQQMEEKIAKLIEAQSTYQSIQNQLHVIPEAVPGNPAAVDVASSIQSLVRTTNASLSALTISSAPLLGTEQSATTSTQATTNALTKPQKMETVPINLVVTGSYSQLISLIQNILSIRRVMTIDSLHIGRATETQSQLLPGNNTLQLVLRLNMYYLTE